MFKSKVSYLTLYYVQFDYSKAFDLKKKKRMSVIVLIVFNCGLLEQNRTKSLLLRLFMLNHT